MEGLVKIGDELVGAVDGQIVLDEVVRPNAQIIDLLHYDIGDRGRRRDLDHHPERDLPVELDPLFLQLLFDLLEEQLDLADFLDFGDHGNQDADVFKHAGPEDGSELDLEKVPMPQGEANGPQPERGVRVLFNLYPA